MLGGVSEDPGRGAGRVTSVGVLVGAYRRGVRRPLSVPETAPAVPAPRQYNTQSSLPHLARTSASTVVVLPMAVPRMSSIGSDAEPCATQTGRDGCSSRPAHQSVRRWSVWWLRSCVFCPLTRWRPPIDARGCQQRSRARGGSSHVRGRAGRCAPSVRSALAVCPSCQCQFNVHRQKQD